MTVVSFKECLPPGEPNKELIETLEKFLKEARAGDLRGCAFAYHYVDGTKGTGWDGADGSREPLATTIMMLNARYAQALLEG